MTPERVRLINLIWQWERVAMVQAKPTEVHRGLWRILDALYDDMVVVRTPGYREQVRAVLAGMKQTADVLAVGKELGLE